MKPIVIITLLLTLGCTVAFGQIKIGDNPQNIDESSVLELESSSRVLVVTRISTAQMEAITPQRGGVVYNTDTECMHYFNGTQWVNLCDAVSFTLTNDAIENVISTISIVDNGATINLEVARNSIRSENIVDGGINGDDIQDNSIGESKLGTDSVSASELRQNSVGTSEVIDGSIQPIDIANTLPNQVLTTDVNGTVIWVDANNLQGAVADEVTITGTGTVAEPLALTVAVTTSISDNSNAIIAETTRATAAEQANANTIADETLRATAAETQNATDIASLQVAKENVSNKDDNTSLGTSDDAYPTQNAVKTYVDNSVGSVGGTGDITSDDLVVTGGVDTAFNDVTLEIANGAIGTTELSNNAVTSIKILDGTIIGDDIANNNITPEKIEQGAPGNILTTDSAGDVIWQAPAVANVNVDGATIIGNGNTFPLSIPEGGITSSQISDGTISSTDLGIDAVATVNILNKNVTPAKIQNGADGEVLTTNATGDVIWALPALGNVNVDGNTIQGNGNTTDLFIPEGGVTSSQIANGTITTEDIAPVTPNPTITQILSTSTVGNVEWIDLSAGSAGTTEEADGTTILGLGTPTDQFRVGTIGSPQITNQSILTEDLNQNGAVDGQVIKWDASINGGLGGWTAANDLVDGTSIPTLTNGYILIGDGTNTPQERLVSGDAIIDNNGILTISEDSVTLPKMAPGTAAGQLLQWDGIDWVYITEADISGFTGTTAGSILFTAPTTFEPTENNGQLFWNQTLNRLGIGTSNPQNKLHVDGEVRSAGYSNSNGTPGEPAYSFTNDTDTGMFRGVPGGGNAPVNWLRFATGGTEAITINPSQFIGIGPTFATGTTIAQRLHVDGNILATGTITPDYVFEYYYKGLSNLYPEYRMSSLKEVEEFTRKNNHLPGVPSALKIKEQGGIILNRATEINLEKIEELFLHTIEQEKKIKELKNYNNSMAKEVELLKAQMEEIQKMLTAKNKN